MEGGAVGLAACLPVRHSSLGTLRPHTRCLSRLLEGLSAGCPNDFCCQLGTRASCARLPLHLAALLPGLAGWRCCLQGLEVLHLQAHSYLCWFLPASVCWGTETLNLSSTSLSPHVSSFSTGLSTLIYVNLLHKTESRTEPQDTSNKDCWSRWSSHRHLPGKEAPAQRPSMSW